MIDPTDKQLVERANSGEEQAMAALYRRHREWVCALAWRFLGNQDDALDVTQMVFAELIQKFPGFELTSSMRAYLYPAVKHQSISFIRKQRKVVPLLPDHQEQSTLQWNQETPGDFSRMVSVLPEPHKEVIILRFGLGMTMDEMASALSLPAGTIKSRLHNALKKLKKSEEKK